MPYIIPQKRNTNYQHNLFINYPQIIQLILIDIKGFFKKY